MIEPVLTVWWFRPVLSALRVGEHSAVVWKLLKRRPDAASMSIVGVWIGPPNVLGPPKPTSSINTMTTLGAPLGALTWNRAGGFALRASSSVYVGGLGSAIGSVVRFMTNRSQAVRLPKEYQFSTAEVFIRKEGEEVILSPRPRDWRLHIETAPVASETFMNDVEDLPVQERRA